jgi:hypothetical protein
VVARKDKIVSGGKVLSGDPSFWRPELLKKLNYFNYQRGNNHEAQSVFEESRRETQAMYNKRKMALDRIKKAMKTGN